MAEASSFASPDHLHSDDPGNQDGGDLDNSNVREQDRYLPIANIVKIMKKALPGPKIAKDAKGKSMAPRIAKETRETVQESVSGFISLITSEASLICRNKKRKMINGEDVLWAMSTLGLDNYVEVLKVSLHKYRESELRDKGWGLNKPGDQASGKKEGGGPSMASGVQMGPDGAYGDRMPNMPAVCPGVQMGPGGVDGDMWDALQAASCDVAGPLLDADVASDAGSSGKPTIGDVYGSSRNRAA